MAGDTDASPTAGNGGRSKAALLNQLKIDRRVEPSDRGKSVKWLLLVAIFGGVGFVAWYFDFPGRDDGVVISTVIAQSSAALPAGATVLDATGYVVARRQATVSSKITGKVVQVLIEEGMTVTHGQLLALLDDSIPRARLELANSQISAAEAGIAELDIQLQQAQLDLDRTRGLAHRNLASKADLDRDDLSVQGLTARIQRALKEIAVAERGMAVQRLELADMEIRAPFDGVVIAKAAQPGEMISPISAGGGFTRTGICTIVDMDSLEVEVDVNEAYINRVSRGQPVQVTLNAYPDDHYSAEVIAIIPAADRNKATVRVRVGFVDKDDRVLPDMGVRVAFLSENTDVAPRHAEPGVTIPSSALGRDAEGDYVYVFASGEVERRAVEVADRIGSRVRVAGGLEGGERVVAELTDELAVSLAHGESVTLVN